MIETPQLGSALQQDLGIDRSYRDLAAKFRLGIERGDLRWPVAREPSVAGVPDDLEQPTLRIPAAIAVEIKKRPQRCFLHDIACIGIVARQPSRKRIGGIEMRQYYFFKPVTMPPIRIPSDLPGFDGCPSEIVRQWEIFLVEVAMPQCADRLD